LVRSELVWFGEVWIRKFGFVRFGLVGEVWIRKVWFGEV